MVYVAFCLPFFCRCRLQPNKKSLSIESTSKRGDGRERVCEREAKESLEREGVAGDGPWVQQVGEV